jgi:hypothetical protein
MRIPFVNRGKTIAEAGATRTPEISRS